MTYSLPAHTRCSVPVVSRKNSLLGGLLWVGFLFGSLSGCQDEAPQYLDVLDMSGDGSASSGLPCDVSQVLSKTCTACHNSTASGLPKLVTYADVTAASTVDPTKKLIERAIVRMQDPARPMPPSGLPPASDVAVLQAWVNAGTPMGSCGTSNPYNTPLVCTSGVTWTGKASSTMLPGRACITCHASSSDAPKFAIAGTVYPTAHEPDSCVGTSGSGTITVEITDSKGTVSTLTPNSSGNFMLRSSASTLVFPYTVKVKQGTKVRAMNAAQTNGDCNSCHTQDGTGGAPGRIMAP
jgi:cytochrome c5